ncbi:MAG: VIT1/CCC1 transporter family protein [Candidatus Sungbacteria bacterium]|uniref:VIT1/CCC1 transporter family protein n=1 Tax=Candidatus Sungiibacteriota bacterium TaxID=2750080 RepID=A0A9D6LTW6_9BACT|nr:VIT1/CCC1 transporter family protein [Candidatus Sungbacteria bacterium]
MAQRTKQQSEIYLRNFIFGVEDSLVSTVGLLAGVAEAGSSRGVILVTGMVYIVVEAFSMAVGSFLSEHSIEEYEGDAKSVSRSIIGASTMFLSFVIAGLIPLFPYLVLSLQTGFFLSIIVSLLALLLLGILNAQFSNKSWIYKSIEMVVIGGAAIAIGLVAGKLFRIA